MDALKGATNGLTIARDFRGEVKRVGADMAILIDHIKQLPGVDTATVDEGVAVMKSGIKTILTAAHFSQSNK